MAQTGQLPAEGQVKCDWVPYDCGACFARRYDMLRHQKEFHGPPKHCPYPKCPYKAKRFGRITKHINDTHAVTLHMPQDQQGFTAQGASQQIQHQDIIGLGPLTHNIIPGNQKVQTGTIGPPSPCYFTTWDYNNNIDTTQSIHGSTYNEPATSIVHHNIPDVSNYSSSEATEEAPPNPDTIPLDEEALRFTLNYAEAVFPYGNNEGLRQFPLSDTETTLNTQTSSEKSAFLNEAASSTPREHHPIHAAALSMDSGLYDADFMFGHQYTGSVSNSLGNYSDSKDRVRQ